MPNEENPPPDPPREYAWWRFTLGVLMILLGPLAGLSACGALAPFELDIRFIDPYEPPDALGDPACEFEVNRDERGAPPFLNLLFGLSEGSLNATTAAARFESPGRYGIYVHWSEGKKSEEELRAARANVISVVRALDFHAIKPEEENAPLVIERVDDPGDQEWREPYNEFVNFTYLTHRFELTEPSTKVRIAWSRPEGWERESLDFIVAPIPEVPHPYDWRVWAIPAALLAVLACWILAVLLFRSGLRVLATRAAFRQALDES